MEAFVLLTYVLASRASRLGSGLGVLLTLLGLGLLVHHGLEANVTSHGVLVEGLCSERWCSYALDLLDQ